MLGIDEYRQAYNSGPYRQLFEKLWGQSRLVFIGFGFSDPWHDFIADSVITETAASSTSSPQHIAIIGLKQSEDYSTERRRNFRDSQSHIGLKDYVRPISSLIKDIVKETTS